MQMLLSSLFATSLSLSPSSMLNQWRSDRIGAFGRAFDASRYHIQVLFVDDDGVRARVCEAMLERVAEWADAGWWIYPNSASIGTVKDGDAPPPSLQRTLSFELAANRLNAPAAVLQESDVSGGYDVIVCTDLAVLEQVRALTRESGGDDAVVLSVCDFLATGSDRLDALDEELRGLVAPEYGRLTSLYELPDALPSGDLAEWRHLLAASALCCASITCYMKGAFDEYGFDAFDKLLAAHYYKAEHLVVDFEACETAMRRHIVSGMLTLSQRQQRFEEHQARLRERLA